jgi:hypothetical protein
MITREFLLHNGFVSVWEDSNSKNEENWTPEFEYIKRIDDNKFITVGYSKLHKWNYEIQNCESHISMSADCQDVIYIDDFQNLIELADIDIYLKRHDGIPFSDFHKNVDFSVLFDFGDNDFSVSIDAAAEIYCDEFNRLLENIDFCDSCRRARYIKEFNNICKTDHIKEILKCGFVSDRLNKHCDFSYGKTPNISDAIEKSYKDLNYIFADDKKNRWEKVDGKNIITEELDRFIAGTHEEITTAILKYGIPHDNPTTNDMFPVSCNSEAVVLYMKDGFLTYTII